VFYPYNSIVYALLGLTVQDPAYPSTCCARRPENACGERGIRLQKGN
jgi:hypothetical protein